MRRAFELDENYLFLLSTMWTNQPFANHRSFSYAIKPPAPTTQRGVLNLIDEILVPTKNKRLHIPYSLLDTT